MVENSYTPPEKFPNENAYLRYALDGLKRTSGISEEVGWGAWEMNKIANFTHVIKKFYKKKTRPFHSVEEVEQFILTLAADLDLGEHAIFGNDSSFMEKYKGRIPDQTKATFHSFCEKLLPKLNDSTDPQETGAFITYEMDLHSRFFGEDSHIIAQALQTFALMRHGRRLPVYRDKVKILHDFMQNVRKYGDYEGWLQFYKNQFQPYPEVKAQEADDPPDQWHVKSANLFDPHNSIFQPENALRNANGMFQLNFVTGKHPQELAVFKPSRILLHETIAALVTRVQLPNINIKEDIKDFLKNDVYKELQDRIKPLDAEFEEMSRRFEEYTRYILDDHFHMVSPHVRTRKILGEEKNVIEKRILSGEYEPRTLESRTALRVLMVDRFLQQFYENKIRKAVDAMITDYLKDNPEKALPLWPNPDRFAWVTAGGPAAGKSSLKDKIGRERIDAGETKPLCYVNPDEFRDFLLEKTGDPAKDSLHSSRTHGEASRITDIILERLDKMVKEDGLAPHIWLDMVSPDEKRTELARHGSAQVRLYVATCPPEEAVKRAFERGKNSPTDKGRFVPTQVVLDGHKKASRGLAKALGAARGTLRLIDTHPTVPDPKEDYVLIAERDETMRTVTIHRATSFMAFINKAAINTGAEKQEELYVPETERNRIIADTLMSYPANNMALNFHYDASEFRSYTGGTELLVRIGRQNALINNLEDFNKIMGNEALTTDLLQRLALRGELTLKNHQGRVILLVEGGKFVYSEDMNPRREGAPELKENAPETRIYRNILTFVKEKLHASDTRLFGRHIEGMADQGTGGIQAGDIAALSKGSAGNISAVETGPATFSGKQSEREIKRDQLPGGTSGGDRPTASRDERLVGEHAGNAGIQQEEMGGTPGEAGSRGTGKWTERIKPGEEIEPPSGEVNSL